MLHVMIIYHYHQRKMKVTFEGHFVSYRRTAKEEIIRNKELFVFPLEFVDSLGHTV